MEKGNHMMRFKDRVVLITGAVRGIGWGISRRFAGEGARVVINDIDEASYITGEILDVNGGIMMD